MRSYTVQQQGEGVEISQPILEQQLGRQLLLILKQASAIDQKDAEIAALKKMLAEKPPEKAPE